MLLCYRLKLGLILLAVLLSRTAMAGPPVFEIKIKDHLFFPDEIPARTKIKLLVINNDSTAEEFESYELNREKVIAGNSKAMLYIGPLEPGTYPFFGEFFPRTAQGKLIAE